MSGFTRREALVTLGSFTMLPLTVLQSSTAVLKPKSKCSHFDEILNPKDHPFELTHVPPRHEWEAMPTKDQKWLAYNMALEAYVHAYSGGIDDDRALCGRLKKADRVMCALHDYLPGFARDIYDEYQRMFASWSRNCEKMRDLTSGAIGCDGAQVTPSLHLTMQQRIYQVHQKRGRGDVGYSLVGERTFSCVHTREHGVENRVFCMDNPFEKQQAIKYFDKRLVEVQPRFSCRPMCKWWQKALVDEVPRRRVLPIY